MTTEAVTLDYPLNPGAAVRAIARLLPADSFVAQFLRLSERSIDAPLVFPLFAALQALESCSGSAIVETPHGPSALHLYTAFVGASGVTRKSSTMDAMCKLVADAKAAESTPPEHEDPEAPVINPHGLMRTPATYQAVKWALAQAAPAKSLAVYHEGEAFFAAAAASREGRAFFMAAYDEADLSDTANGARYRILLPSARLSVAVCLTPEQVVGSLSDVAWLQGLAGRFLWVYGEAERPGPGTTSPSSAVVCLRGAREALRRVVAHAATVETLTLPPAALAVITEWAAKTHDAGTQSEAVVLSRCALHATKITALLAMDAGTDPTHGHAKAACAIVNLANQSTVGLYRKSREVERRLDERRVTPMPRGPAPLATLPSGYAVGSLVESPSDDEAFAHIVVPGICALGVQAVAVPVACGTVYSSSIVKSSNLPTCPSCESVVEGLRYWRRSASSKAAFDRHVESILAIPTRKTPVIDFTMVPE
jgi:hypothetical protein